MQNIVVISIIIIGNTFKIERTVTYIHYLSLQPTNVCILADKTETLQNAI